MDWPSTQSDELVSDAVYGTRRRSILLGRELFTFACIYMPFFGNDGMSKRSQDLRNRAARELRSSRNGGTAEDKVDNKKRASALKNLSENEEWLDGERTRPRPRK